MVLFPVGVPGFELPELPDPPPQAVPNTNTKTIGMALTIVVNRRQHPRLVKKIIIAMSPGKTSECVWPNRLLFEGRPRLDMEGAVVAICNATVPTPPENVGVPKLHVASLGNPPHENEIEFDEKPATVSVVCPVEPGVEIVMAL